MKVFQRNVDGLRTRLKTAVEYERVEVEMVLAREMKLEMRNWSCSRPL